jgi:hypothetical protein
MEQLVEREFTRETEILGENLPQYYFVRQKSHMTWDRTRAPVTRNQRLTA